jgi:hypothetical protein
MCSKILGLGETVFAPAQISKYGVQQSIPLNLGYRNPWMKEMAAKQKSTLGGVP